MCKMNSGHSAAVTYMTWSHDQCYECVTWSMLWMFNGGITSSCIMTHPTFTREYIDRKIYIFKHLFGFHNKQCQRICNFHMLKIFAIHISVDLLTIIKFKLTKITRIQHLISFTISTDYNRQMQQFFQIIGIRQCFLFHWVCFLYDVSMETYNKYMLCCGQYLLFQL